MTNVAHINHILAINKQEELREKHRFAINEWKNIIARKELNWREMAWTAFAHTRITGASYMEAKNEAESELISYNGLSG
jgi:hypothetical protein